VEMLADFLVSIDLPEVGPSIRLLLGRPLPETEPWSMEVGYAIIEKVKAGKQRTLFGEEPGIEEVLSGLRRVAEVSGAGSRRNKENLLQNLFGRLSETGKEYLKRSLYGELRIGVSEGVMLEALSRASGRPLEEIRRANMISGDLAEMAQDTMEGDRLPSLPRLFIPIRPMLAESAESVEEALEIMGKAAFEHKLDGIRVQVHKLGSEVRIFSRRLTDVTQSLPELLEVVGKIGSDELVVEGEVIGFTDRPLPFQDLMRRFMRVKKREETMRKVPVRLFLFDILILNGIALMDRPYEERWALLESVAPHLVVGRLVTADPKEAGRFMEEALSQGHEGLMAKELNGVYTAGKRGGRWLKIKRSHSLDLVIVAAEWGHGRRKGWLSDYYLAARSKDGFSPVGKTFKGLTDDQFKNMTESLVGLKTDETEYGIVVQPRIVVEVAFDEVQTSTKYPSGMALRFARIKAIRWDKRPEEADTLAALRMIYDRQFSNKSRLDI
jgi:DNA ligase 1